jgi:hypothetical protein
MARTIGAILLGAIVAFLLIAAVHAVSAQVYPVPEGLMQDKEGMARHIASLPIGAFLFVLAAYLIGTVGGVATAVRVGRAKFPGYAVGALLICGSLANLLMFPHPVWFAVANLAIVIAATYLMTRGAAARSATIAPA